MSEEKTEEPLTIEVPEEYPKRAGDTGVMAAGIFGDTDPAALADRQKRIDNFKERYSYRECVPCDRCTFCLEMRRFSQTGIEEISGLFCLSCGDEVTSLSTCSYGRANRKGRKKVVYDMQYAPPGFRLGIEAKSKLQTAKESKESTGEGRNVFGGYRGGSDFYNRADGDREAIGSGKIPRSLGN